MWQFELTLIVSLLLKSVWTGGIKWFAIWFLSLFLFLITIILLCFKNKHYPHQCWIRFSSHFPDGQNYFWVLQIFLNITLIFMLFSHGLPWTIAAHSLITYQIPSAVKQWAHSVWVLSCALYLRGGRQDSMKNLKFHILTIFKISLSLRVVCGERSKNIGKNPEVLSIKVLGQCVEVLNGFWTQMLLYDMYL